MTTDFAEMPLFALTRRDDHETSVEASEKVSLKLSEKRLAVLRFAYNRWSVGFTDSDLKLQWPSSPESTYRKRRSELTEYGYLETTGEKRLNAQSNNETVWRITPKGIDAILKAGTDDARQ